MDISDLVKWILDSDTLKKAWAYVSNYFTPPYSYRFNYDDNVGFRLDENNCPLCPICLNEYKVTPGKYSKRYRTLTCPIHGEVKGTKAIAKKNENKNSKIENKHSENKSASNNIDSIFELLIQIAKQMPTDWPLELPSENTPGFWKKAACYESALRGVISRKIKVLFDNNKGILHVKDWTPLEAWLYCRRVDFVINILFEATRRRVSLKDEPYEALKSFLLETWDEYGAIAFWFHAIERDGKPAADADPILVEIMK